MRITILGCGKSKVGGDEPVAVRDLYTSSLFTKSLTLAEATSDVVYVASAQHGLVTLDEKYRPYDQTLKGWGLKEHMAWGARVASTLLQRHKLYAIPDGKPGPVMSLHRITILAGQEYSWPIEADLKRSQRASSALSLQLDVKTPMAGLMVGERLAWLNLQLVGLGLAKGSGS